jgi:hypothetical protein
MNRYTYDFVVECPNNGIKVSYQLMVETYGKIFVEDIIAACAVEKAFHEDLADLLHKRFGGKQVIQAYHHGVWIETRRGDV